MVLQSCRALALGVPGEGLSGTVVALACVTRALYLGAMIGFFLTSQLIQGVLGFAPFRALHLDASRSTGCGDRGPSLRGGADDALERPGAPREVLMEEFLEPPGSPSTGWPSRSGCLPGGSTKSCMASGGSPRTPRCA